ncbi:cobalt ECF transporter T component CbiQ [Heliorestis acidaminivorans]|uniref:Cobalt ECF transporter T component CbiQ n=1 Tax=Heliorestis acidaminivorans TaxID=553427 RepID=A0A6I0EQ23_9FIRM|nr:cobalt ECF transporter T component CbiQ [Heliorestis acidaminivorans]KAB2952117.1 cobalt ECF transporter T component CbiQ [Heliorestis acidaminivorans]
MVGLKLDPFVHRNSWLHQWDPRYKFIGLMFLIFAFTLVQEVHLIPAMALVTALLFLQSSLPWRVWLSRLLVPAFFLLALAIVLPFFAGETVLWQLGPLALRLEGLLAFLLVAGKVLSIITIVFILFATTPMLLVIKAMRSLGLPELMADMLLFTYRYLFQLQDDYEGQSTAARLRGYQNSTSSLQTTSFLLGTLLVRSYEQSERIYKAMRLRGYGQHAFYAYPFSAESKDRWIFLLVTLVALVFALLG